MRPQGPDTKNLIIALVLAAAVLLTWEITVSMPQKEQAAKQAAEIMKKRREEREKQQELGLLPAEVAATAKTREELITHAPRLKIAASKLHGSVSLKGARFDDLTLANYHEEVDPSSPEVVLLSPAGNAKGYFVEFGWTSASKGVKTPDADSLWQADVREIVPGTPVTLTWDNGEGLTFFLTLTLDEHYMFTVAQSVKNATANAVTLTPYALINRAHAQDKKHTAYLHEGPVGVFGHTLTEVHYDDIKEDKEKRFDNTNGWVGIGDKYWLTALLPDANERFTTQMRYYERGGLDRYQVDFAGEPLSIPPGSTMKHDMRFFAGAKEVKLLDTYRDRYGIPLFDRAVDFGWLYFLTKPIFLLLDWLKDSFGNVGLAIIALTLIIRVLLFPLANKSYKSMAAMKRLQPEMLELRDRYKTDPVNMNKEIMALYRKEKVNPMTGCLPVLLQLPVFFALYKVLYTTIEIRHAPFYGWIHDLSAPDPTNLFTLFGLIPWDPPSLLHVGIWPLIMCVTMVLQQKLQPAPTDPVQAKMMMALPYVFLFLFASFPAGLVIYWALSNTFSIVQQWWITRHDRAEKEAQKKKIAA